MPNSAKSMPLNFFKMIVTKAKLEGYDLICLYNWTEPFLNKRLPEYISIVKESGLACDISSNLSIKRIFDTIERSLSAGLDSLIVSISGLDQKIYEINHKGGEIAYVRENLEYISKLLQNNNEIKTKVSLKYIKFDYNAHEETELRKYADSLSFDFMMIDGVGHPSKPVNLYASEESFLNRIKNYRRPSIYEKDGEICSLIFDSIPIDCDGNVYLCCAQPNFPILQIGKYADMTKNELLVKRYTHPFCKSCPGYRRKATTYELNILDTAISDFSSISLDKNERSFIYTNDILQNKLSYISCLELDLKFKESMIEALETNLKVQKSKISFLEIQLQQINNGITIKLLNYYQRIINKLLRIRTFMRHYYDLFFIGIKIILNEGWRSFWRKFKKYYK